MPKWKPTNWWRMVAIAFAALAAWNCSEARDWESRYYSENNRAVRFLNLWTDVCDEAGDKHYRIASDCPWP